MRGDAEHVLRSRRDISMFILLIGIRMGLSAPVADRPYFMF